MPVLLHIISTFYITPLIDMGSAEFTEGYRQGVRQLYGWRVHEQMQAQEPLSVSSLVNKLQTIVKLDYFDGHDDQRLLNEIGYLLGMYHGSVLSPYTGKLRSDLNLLTTYEDVDSMHGYNIGREWCFLDAEPHELRRTEAILIEYLRELASESVQFHDDGQTWHHAIGCLRGELSDQLFPATLRSFRNGNHNARNALRTTTGTQFSMSKGLSASNCAPFPIVGTGLRTGC